MTSSILSLFQWHAILDRWHNLQAVAAKRRHIRVKVLVDDVVGRDWCWFRIVYCSPFVTCVSVLNLAEKRQTLFVPKITVIVAGIVIDLFCLLCRPKCCSWVAFLWFQFEGKTLVELHVCWYEFCRNAHCISYSWSDENSVLSQGDEHCWLSCCLIWKVLFCSNFFPCTMSVKSFS